MKKISLFLILMIASMVFYACQNTSEDVTFHEGTNNHVVSEQSDIVETTHKTIARKEGAVLTLVHSQEALKSAIISAYAEVENVAVVVDEDVEIISDINPETNELGYGIAFSLTLSTGEHHYLVYQLGNIEGNDFVITLGNRCESNVCTLCKKPLFKPCTCSSKYGACFKHKPSKKLEDAFLIGL